MTNIRKSFNFRNGVQVDTNNFIVNPVGLVGIGTTIPSQSLDVVGNAKISGITSTDNLQSTTLSATDATITRISLSDSIIGSGVSIQSGIITHTELTGLVTYYGDARFLQGMPTSQWVDIDVGLGFTSIYNTGFVGVATVDPRFSLQIGGTNDVVNFESGVGIHSSGNIWATGVTTSGFFVGIGSNITLLNASNIGLGTISNDRLPIIDTDRIPSNINSPTGIITASTIDVTSIDVGIISSGNIYSTGIVTAGIVSATSADVSFIRAGVITSYIDGDLSGNAGTATSLATSRTINDVSFDGTANIIVEPYIEDDEDNVGYSKLVFTDDSTQGYKRLNEDSSLTYNPLFNVLNTGIATFSSSVRTPFLGINTSTTSFAHSIEVHQDVNAATLTLGSINNYSGIYLSRVLDNIGQDSALIRYGNVSASFPYSTENSADFLNFGDGNVNFYLQAGPVGVNTGDFHWHSKSGPIATLTNQGRLGLGITDPEHILDVAGISSFNGEAYFTQNVIIETDLTVNTLTLLGVLEANPIIGNLTGNVNAEVGISTFEILSVTGIATIEQLGIGDAVVGGTPRILGVGLTENAFTVEPTGRIGVATDQFLYAKGVNAPSVDSVFGIIGVGTDRFNPIANPCAVDFGNVGSDQYGLAPNREYMRVPRVTAAQIAAFTGLIGGEIVYDTTNNVHKGYNGTTWNDLY